MADSFISTVSFEQSAIAASEYAMVSGKAIPTATEYLFGGQVYSTASDMALWIVLWMKDGGGVIPPGYVRQAGSMQAISDGSPPDEVNPGVYLSGYGYGWRIRPRNAHYQVEHGGNENGFSAQVSFVPVEKIGVVALTNQQTSILRYIANDVLTCRLLGQNKIEHSDYPIQVQPAAPLLEIGGNKLAMNIYAPAGLDPSELVGEYDAPEYGRLSVAFSRGVLTLTTPAAHFILTHRAGDVYGLGTNQPLPIGINIGFFEVRFLQGALTANCPSSDRLRHAPSIRCS